MAIDTTTAALINPASKYLLPYDPANPYASTINYEALFGGGGVVEQAQKEAKKIGIAGEMKEYTPGMPVVTYGLRKTIGKAMKEKSGIFGLGGGMPKAGKAMILAALESAQTTAAAFQTKANLASSALGVVGSGVESALKGYERVREEVGRAGETIGTLWDGYVKVMADSVKSSHERSVAAFNEIDRLSKEVGTGRDYAKLRALEAATVSTVDSLKIEEREALSVAKDDRQRENIRQQYAGAKTKTLAQLSGNLEASYQATKEQTNVAMAGLKATAMETMGQQELYAEWNFGKAHEARASYLGEFGLKTAQMKLTIESLIAEGFGTVANWIQQTPVYAVTLEPIIQALLGAKAMGSTGGLLQAVKDIGQIGATAGMVAGWPGAVAGGITGFQKGMTGLGTALQGLWGAAPGTPSNWNKLAS